jgi:hypothetical protein
MATKQTQSEKIDFMSEKLDRAIETIESIHKALVGNIEEGTPGLFTRTDRLEQQQIHSREQWVTARGLMVGIILALIPLTINSCQQRLESTQEHQQIAEVVQEEERTEITPTGTAFTTDTLTPPATPTAEATPIPASSVEIKALSALCWVETRGMGIKKPVACASVLSTVFTRASEKLMSDGTILGTIRWGCRPENTTCQFPAFVSFGCEGITHPCPFDDPKGMVEFMGYVYQYLYGELSGECSGFTYYNVDDLSDSGARCIIRNDNQAMYFWDEEK